MSNENLTGKVQAVLGPISPDDLGPTLPLAGDGRSAASTATMERI